MEDKNEEHNSGTSGITSEVPVQASGKVGGGLETDHAGIKSGGQKRWGWWWGLVGLMIVLAVGVGWWVVRKGVEMKNNQAEEKKVYRIGVLSGLEFVAEITDAFTAEMTELGYVEDTDVVYDVQRTDFDISEYKKVLTKFVNDKVDLIFVFPTEASIEAKAATEGTGIPVVFSFALVEGMNLVDSIREPGGNITGVRYPGPDIALKRFEILRELVPDATRVLVPFQRGYPIVDPQLAVLNPEAEKAGIELMEMPADNAVELSSLLAKVKATDVDAILFLAEPLAVTADAFEVIANFAVDRQIPIGGALMRTENYGSVFGVSVDTRDSGRRAATMADKILKGVAVGTIPVISADTYFQVDYKMIQTLGLKANEELLLKADEIIR